MTMGGTNPTTMLEGISTYIQSWEAWPSTMSKRFTDSSLPLGRNLDLENTKILPEVLKLHSGQRLGQHISYLLVHCNILELHCYSLHHIPDILIFDLDMLRLVMEHEFFDNFTQLWLLQYIQVASN